MRVSDVRLKLLPLKMEGLSPLLERRKGRIGTGKGRWGGGEREGDRADRNGGEQVVGLTGDARELFSIRVPYMSSLCVIGSCMIMSLDQMYED
jgi:hypothetical protein